MEQSINDNVTPAALRDPTNKWWIDTKASDEFLDPVFEAWLQRLGLPISLMKKSDYHVLAGFVPRELIAPEVGQVLNSILQVSQTARPRGQES